MRLIDADNIQDELAALILYSAGTPEGECVEYAHNLIDAQPTIDAVPVVHAHWIHDHDVEHYGKHYGAYWRCSSCGRILKDSNWFPYCPMCGARMDGEVEGRKKDEFI